MFDSDIILTVDTNATEIKIILKEPAQIIKRIVVATYVC